MHKPSTGRKGTASRSALTERQSHLLWGSECFGLRLQSSRTRATVEDGRPGLTQILCRVSFQDVSWLRTGSLAQKWLPGGTQALCVKAPRPMQAWSLALGGGVRQLLGTRTPVWETAWADLKHSRCKHSGGGRVSGTEGRRLSAKRVR